MNVVKCSQGHFYDADKFTTCPHCGSREWEIKSNESIRISRIEETVALKEEDVQIFEKKENVFEAKNLKNNRSSNIFSKILKKEQGITDEIISIPSSNVSVFGGEAPVSSVRYIVGWIVYLNGEKKGISCELKSGNNFIGSGIEMDIQVPNETSVVCRNHAKIVFEPNKLEFFLVPGETSELIYMNDEIAMVPQKINPYDEILVGNTKLLFIPLCGNQFTWQGEDK